MEFRHTSPENRNLHESCLISEDDTHQKDASINILCWEVKVELTQRDLHQ